jgi:PAS domain S-box-containing protein
MLGRVWMDNSQNKASGSNFSKISLIAFLFGFLSIAFSLFLGNSTFNSSLDEFEQQYREFYLREAKILMEAAQISKSTNDKNILNEIQTIWEASGEKPADEYICIVDKNSNLIMHTAHPNTIGNYAGSNPIFGNNDIAETCLADLVKSKRDYVGDYTSSSGQNQLAAFASLPGKSWVVGVHRSKEELIKDIEKGMKISKIGFYLVCGILMPLSWVLIFLTFRFGERKRKVAEKALLKSEMISHALLNASTESAFLMETDGNFVIVNDVAAKRLGKKKDELIGKCAYDFLPPQVAQSRRNYIEELIQTGEPTRFIDERSGVVIDNSAYPLFDSQGKVNRVAVFARDITKEKESIEKLRQSEERFRGMFENAPLSYQSLDSNGDFLEVNKTFLKVLGYERNEVIGRNFSEFLHPDWREHFKNNFPILKSIGEVLGVEFELMKKDGSTILVLLNGTISKDRDGNFKQTHCVFEDISERHKAAERLKESEEKYRKVFENLVVGIFQSTPSGSFIEVNPALANILGYDSPHEFIAKNKDIEIQFYEKPGLRKKYLNMLKEKGKVDGFEFEAKCKDGTTKWLSESTHVYFDENGNALKFEGIIIDITERKLSENEINKQKRLFETMFNTIPDGVIITNTKREIQLANKGMKTTFGYDPKELIGKESKFLYATQDKFKETGENVFGKDAKKPGNLFITRYKDKNRREFSGETFGAKLYDEDNQWIGNLGIMRDITERERAEMRVQQAQKMESIGNLAGGIAHDFNNILFPIIGYAEMLIDDLPLNSPERENAEGIMTAGKRGSELVKQILAFSRQNEHKMIPVRVQQVLKEVVKLSRSSIPTNIEINHHLQQDCGLVLADSTQLHQIGMNLITNAYHAVEEKSGKIEVQVKDISFEKDELTGGLLRAGKYVQLSVSDNGCGISQVVMDKIFEPYFTTKKKGKGTGLGLSVVYGIVKEHKGDIKVFSEVGKGTTIKVNLPVIAVSGATESSSEQIPVGRGTERILLVDDEVPIASLMKQMLERLGYSVSIRTSSVDALEAFKAKSNAFDLVITDMSMPHMTGDQLASEILSVRPDIPIIICTGFSERVNEDMAKSMGIKGFLMKPVIKSALAQEVRKVLDDAGKI